MELDKIARTEKLTENDSAAARVAADETATEKTEAAARSEMDSTSAGRVMDDEVVVKNSVAEAESAQQSAVGTAMKKLMDMPQSWSDKLFGFKNGIMLACGMSISLTISMKSCSIGHT